ncbi:GFA family protein [Hyphomonas sp.]|jgi:hypothetical protein|uniref:GFA family protein n=1 Tax=Hyphomonas sp. TaxID=87 RepID=UPI0025C5E884|nr:GFA family protein [Hyphomonas sp.]
MKRIALNRPPLPKLPMEGGCHCGAVRYGVTARPMAVNACHCDDCKRLAGGPFGLYLHVAKDALQVSGGARDVFTRTGGSGNAIPVERCAVCGTRMWHLPAVAPDLVILCAGTLDDSTWAVPTSHIFIEYAAADAVAAEDAIAVESFQTTRPALWARFSEIYP